VRKGIETGHDDSSKKEKGSKLTEDRRLTGFFGAVQPSVGGYIFTTDFRQSSPACPPFPQQQLYGQVGTKKKYQVDYLQKSHAAVIYQIILFPAYCEPFCIQRIETVRSEQKDKKPYYQDRITDKK
jgi:hypothetical protein